jgi:hypothetical protein
MLYLKPHTAILNKVKVVDGLFAPTSFQLRKFSKLLRRRDEGETKEVTII